MKNIKPQNVNVTINNIENFQIPRVSFISSNAFGSTPKWKIGTIETFILD